MQQFFADLKRHMQDRFGNPFWLSALFAWCVLNWPLLITATFQTEYFNVRYIINYCYSNPTYRYIWAPLGLGLIYSIFSGVLKETLEGIARSSRSFIARKFKDWGFYPSISLEEHQKEISNLERRLIRNEFRKSELDALQVENDNLGTEIQQERERTIKIESILIDKLTSKDPIGHLEKIELLDQLQSLDICTEISKTDIEQPETKPEDSAHSKNKASETSGYKSEKTNSEARKAESASTNPTRNTLSGSISNHEKTEINDPNSLKSLLLTLLLFKSPQVYSHSPNPNDIGLEKGVFQKCLQTAFKAKLLQRHGNGNENGFGLTSEGIRYIKKELTKETNRSIDLILKEAEKKTTSQIIKSLREKHLSPTELSKQVQYHPDFSRILMDLERENVIQDRGSILFLNE